MNLHLFSHGSLSAERIAAVLLSERPTRDGSKWADGARDEWSTTVLAFALALFGPDGAARSAFVRACGLE
jgi:hypothetical protein